MGYATIILAFKFVIYNRCTGLEQAKQDACPAYLEATPAADSLYRKLGLEAIGDIDVDLTDVGIDFKTTLRKMRANPYVETKLENRQ